MQKPPQLYGPKVRSILERLRAGADAQPCCASGAAGPGFFMLSDRNFIAGSRRPFTPIGQFLFYSFIGVSLLLAGSAFAQSHEEIVFDFTADSSFSLLGGTIITPPDGSFDVGAGTISVEAAAPGTFVVGGFFILDALEIGGTVTKDVFGQAQIDGVYSANQVSPLVGTLASGMSGGDFTDDLALDLNIVMGCVGSGCITLGFPISDIGVSLFRLSFLSVTDLGVVGSSRIEATLPIEIDGVLGSIELVGVEVSRSFVVPEPGTFVLLAMGLVALAAKRH